MTTQLERIEYELRKAGYNLKEREEINSDDDYAQAIGTSVWKVCKEFCSHDHSGYSAGMALHMIKTLLIDEKPLTQLTNNPDEWTDISECCVSAPERSYFHSKRDFSCFSDDGLKTYYDIDDPDNREWELDENGNKTGWSSRKPDEQLKRIALKGENNE